MMLIEFIIIGSYKCGCHSAFDSVDNVSGVCKSPSPWNLLFSDGSNVISLNTTQRKEREVIFGQKRIQSLDFDPHSHIVFWTDPIDLAVKRSFIPQPTNQVEVGHPQTIVTFTKTAVPVGLSVDWVGQNIYWLEMDGQTFKGQVSTAKNDGRYRRSVVPRGIDTPTSIALNPIVGELYWSQAGSNPRIEVAWMDGIV